MAILGAGYELKQSGSSMAFCSTFIFSITIHNGELKYASSFFIKYFDMFGSVKSMKWIGYIYEKQFMSHTEKDLFGIVTPHYMFYNS